MALLAAKLHIQTHALLLLLRTTQRLIQTGMILLAFLSMRSYLAVAVQIQYLWLARHVIGLRVFTWLQHWVQKQPQQLQAKLALCAATHLQ